MPFACCPLSLLQYLDSSEYVLRYTSDIKLVDNRCHDRAADAKVVQMRLRLCYEPMGVQALYTSDTIQQVFLEELDFGGVGELDDALLLETMTLLFADK